MFSILDFLLSIFLLPAFRFLNKSLEVHSHLIDDQCLLSRLITNSRRVKHDDDGKDGRDGKKWRIEPDFISDCSRQAMYTAAEWELGIPPVDVISFQSSLPLENNESEFLRIEQR